VLTKKKDSAILFTDVSTPNKRVLTAKEKQDLVNSDWSDRVEGLGERKVKILNAIIRNYLETGEPVGSRTISKYEDMNLSSATIRNEMSDLEEMGYIVQPHTSAGRIPSDKGYRFYVDHLMEEKEKEISDMKNFVIEHTEKVDLVLQQIAKMLAANTNYTTMVTAPRAKRNAVKFIQLSSVDETHLLAVIVIEGNIVRNKMLNIAEPLDNETLLKLNILLNTGLNGLTIEEINLGTISMLKEKAGSHSDIVNQVLDAVGAAIHEGKDLEIYTSGATNIFKYPELCDSEKATELLNVLEEKEQLATFVTKTGDETETGIQVYIGDEAPIQNMKDCSIVTATYNMGDGMTGTVGIIGPKRMDYENVVDNLKTLKVQLDDIFRKDR
jgi:heat shock gene repressor HrcA